MESRSLKEVAYSSIKKRILSGVLAPGDVISERTFVEELGISRTPVHEAMALLAEEGLVRIMPSRGMVVSPISMKDIRTCDCTHPCISQLGACFQLAKVSDGG